MKINKILIVVLMFVLSSTLVLGQGLAPPLHFYGDVTVNGQNAPDTTIITVHIKDSSVGSTTPVDGVYGKDPASFFLVSDTSNGNPSALIEFIINDEVVHNMTYADVDSDRSTQVDLSYTGDLDLCGDVICSGSESCSSCSEDCGECSSSSGSSGSSGGSSSGSSGSSGGSSGSRGGGSGRRSVVVEPTTQVEENEDCTPNWECSDFTACSNGVRERVCIDANQCGDDTDKPTLQQSCAVVNDVPQVPTRVVEEEQDDTTAEAEEQPQQNAGFNFITGFVTSGSAGSISAIVLIGIIVVGLVGYFYFRKN